LSNRREALRRELEESDSSSDLNEDLASESTAPQILAISESQINSIGEDESTEEVQSTVGSVMQRVVQIQEDESAELSQESSNEPSYLNPPPSIDPPRIAHGVNLSQPPS
jgi:hypothetical protein